MKPEDQQTLFRLLAEAITEKAEAPKPVESAPEPVQDVPDSEPKIPSDVFRAEGRARREAAVEGPRDFAARRAAVKQPDFVGIDVAVAERAVDAYKKAQASRLLKVGAMPLIAVCIVICAVLAYRDFDAFLLLFSASGRVIVGATIGLLIDLFAMPNHQPENLEGIEQGWAWNRRLWLMAASAVCLGMQP